MRGAQTGAWHPADESIGWPEGSVVAWGTTPQLTEPCLGEASTGP